MPEYKCVICAYQVEIADGFPAPYHCHYITRKVIGTCPRCNGILTEHSSLSRHDNKTEICNDCGQREAFEDMSRATVYKGKRYWVVRR